MNWQCPKKVTWPQQGLLVIKTSEKVVPLLLDGAHWISDTYSTKQITIAFMGDMTRRLP